MGPIEGIQKNWNINKCLDCNAEFVYKLESSIKTNKYAIFCPCCRSISLVHDVRMNVEFKIGE